MSYLWSVLLLTIKSCARHGFRDEIMRFLKIAASFAFATFAVCANAQNLSKVFFEKSRFNFIPSTLTSDGSDQLSTRQTSYYEFPKAISIYDVNMKLIKTIKTSNNIGIFPINYTDNGQGCLVFATQNLFDKDNSYEYIVPIGSYDEIAHMAKAVGLRIVKEGNTTIAEILFDEKWTMFVSDWDNFKNWDIKVFSLFDDLNLKEHLYLAVEVQRDGEGGSDGATATLVYAFERGKVSTSIKKVNEIKNSIKAIPSMPQKNEVVKVDLSSIQSPKKLLVVSSEGKIVCSKNLSSDQKETTVETGDFPAGMYIIQVADAKNIRENCRIIIR